MAEQLGDWYGDTGDALTAQGDLPAALASYQAGLAIDDRLVKSDPGNAGWRGDLALLHSKIGYELFALGRTQEALDDFDAATKIGSPKNAANIYRGRALAKLYADDAAGAADDAATAAKLDPTDAYSALWLHVARARAGQDDADELAANAKALDRGKWPWPVVALFLGSASPDETQEAAAAAAPSEQLDQSCEAYFFIGVYQTEKGAPADARASLQSAADRCPNGHIQRSAAMFELKRLERFPSR